MTELEVARLRNELNTLNHIASAKCLVTYMDYAEEKVPKNLKEFYDIGKRQNEILEILG